MLENLSGHSWVEINLDAISHNYKSVKERLDPNVKVLGVVKADAYGHGALEVSRLLVSCGIDMLGVTTVQEGRFLRERGIEAPILVFGSFLPSEAGVIVQYGLVATVAGMDSIEWLEKALAGKAQQLAVHIKIETGMGRLGFWPEEAVAAAKRIKEAPNLILDGVYSHLSTAMNSRNTYVQRQISIFKNVLAGLKGAGITGFTAHLANSAAIMNFPETHLDMVRAGTLLYGQSPAGPDAKIDLRDPWSLKTRVIYLKDLPPGHSVGYGRTYVTKRKTRMALLPLGYVDGISMEPILKPSGLTDMLKGMAKIMLQYIGHSRVRIPVHFPGGTGYVIGKPGMQLTMVDATDIPDIEVGTPACVTARRTAVNPAISKVFMKNSEIIAITRFDEKSSSPPDSKKEENLVQ